MSGELQAHKSIGRAEAERRMDEVKLIVYKMIRSEVKACRHHDPSDLFQDAMVGVFTHIDKWDPNKSSFSNYVWLTAKSYVYGHVLARDKYDCHKVNLTTLSLDAPCVRSPMAFGRDRLLSEVIPSDFALEDVVMSKVELQRVLESLNKLGDKRIRKIIQMHYIDGMRLRDISKVMGISKQRVSQLEHHGLKRLRILLGTDERMR